MVLCVLNARIPGAWKKVGGIPLIARTLFHLNQLGLKIVVPLWDADHPPQNLKIWQGEVHVESAQVEVGLPAAILSILNLAKHFIYIDAGHLIAPRLLQALLSASGATLCYIDAANREKQVILAGLLSKEDIRIWSNQGILSWFIALRLFSRGISIRFVPRSAVLWPPITWRFVRKRMPGRRLTCSSGVNKSRFWIFGARFIHPPLENALTALLVETPSTPNGVTIIVASLGFLISWLVCTVIFLRVLSSLSSSIFWTVSTESWPVPNCSIAGLENTKILSTIFTKIAGI
jgi:hypothetical protein